MSATDVYIHGDRANRISAYVPEGADIKHLVCIKVDYDTSIWLTHAQGLKLADDLRALLTPADALRVPQFTVDADGVHEVEVPE